MEEQIRGKGAVGIAIAFFALRGMVSIPMEPSEYNLIFDDGKDLFKIKVISCAFKTPYGVYSASIRTMGGTKTAQTVKTFDSKSCDYVFIVTSELDMYNIPSGEITSKRQISLSVYSQFKVKFGDVVE